MIIWTLPVNYIKTKYTISFFLWTNYYLRWHWTGPSVITALLISDAANKHEQTFLLFSVCWQVISLQAEGMILHKDAIQRERHLKTRVQHREGWWLWWWRRKRPARNCSHCFCCMKGRGCHRSSDAPELNWWHTEEQPCLDKILIKFSTFAIFHTHELLSDLHSFPLIWQPLNVLVPCVNDSLDAFL